MTATRDRRSDPEEDAEPAWDERSILGMSRGLPWWGAVLLAFGLAAIGATFDMQRQDSLGRIYQGAYVLGCVAAICLVRRRSLFGPMVQPPLVFAVTAVGAIVMLAPDDGGGGGLKGLLFSVALPLTSNFPTMAGTTGVTVAIGLFRLWRESDPDPAVRPNRPPKADREHPGKDRVSPSRRRRADLDDLDADDVVGGRSEPGARRGGSARTGGPGRRGTSKGASRSETPPRRESARRGDSEGRRGDPGSGGRRGDPEAGRRDREPGRRGGSSGGRRGAPEPGRGKGDRPSRPRPDADPDVPPEGRRGMRGREPRPDQTTGDRDTRGADRAGRTGRGRTRDAEPPSRRRDPTPRRDDRSARRDAGDRATPARQPRRRPQDPYR